MSTTCTAGILSLQLSWTINNLLSYCGLVDAKIRASENYLPVHNFFFLELWTTAVNLINQKVMQKHSCSLCPAANLCICLQHCSVVSKYPQSLQTKSKIDNIVSSFISNYKCSKLPNSRIVLEIQVHFGNAKTFST